MKFQAIKGVRDILPPESALWNRVEQAASSVFRTYGYGEIRLPIFEPTELFARSVGLDTDIVSKEMYSFEDRSFLAREEIRDFASFAEFVVGAERAFKIGEIPQTSNNASALGAMVRYRDE